MAKKQKKKNIFIAILLWAIIIIYLSFCSALITILILVITDYFTFEPEPYTKTYFINRVNWIFAGIVFVITFITLELWNHKYFKRVGKRDDGTLIELKVAASERGKKPEAFIENNSFGSAFEIDSTRFEGSFQIQRIPQKGPDQRYCVARVSFDVTGTSENFYIEKKEHSDKPEFEMYSIAPVYGKNATKKLDGRYDYTYSDYQFFNEFLGDDEISEDILNVSNEYGKGFSITLKDRKFTIQSRTQTASGEDLSQEESVDILKNMYPQAQKYFLRFQKMGLIDK